jgi:hypothetical protein
MTILRSIVPVSLALGLAACTTMGTGVGSTTGGTVRAVMSWESTGGRTGTMTARLSTGETYAGMYFQITSETRVDGLGQLWVGWARPWPGWPYWGYEPGPQFITHYSGRVVANLEGPRGHMRCSFQLIRPAAGMAGGGQGQCQLPNGETIDATFPPA